MDAGVLGFAADVMVLSIRLVPLMVALGLALLIRTKLHAVLIVANLWLFMELATTLFEPGYAFGSLLYPRLAASAVQVALGYGAVSLWQHWRNGAERVTVH